MASTRGIRNERGEIKGPLFVVFLFVYSSEKESLWVVAGKKGS
jgi:hypothetical protein